LLGLFVAELVWLHGLTHYDLAVYDWMQAYRSCGLDRLALSMRYWTTKPYATVALVLAVSGWLLYLRRWQDLGRVALITIGGALLCEWIKLLVSRPRPSALAFIDYGSSFPSGHVTSAVTIFGAAYYCLAKCYLRRWWQHGLAIAGVVAMVLLIGFQRVYFTHHWISDAIGGALLGGAWLFFALDHFSVCVNRRSTLVIAAIFAGAFVALRIFPSLRLNGPMPMALRGAPLSLVDLTAYAPETIRRKDDILASGRAPEATWYFSNPTTTIDLPLAVAGDYYLVFAARPRNTVDTSCRSIGILLNDRQIANLVIYNGWRDYRIPLERSWLSSTSNRLTVILGPGKQNAVVFTTPAIHARAKSP
jgi:undecaprenyl-diphosphatase